MKRTFWQAIREHDYAVPLGYTAVDLTPELVGLLGSADARVRDELAYNILAYWIERGEYSADELRGLAMTLVQNLAGGLGEHSGDAVLRRSYSALVLSEILLYEQQQPFLSANEVDNLLRWALEYLATERDLRGYSPKQGWIHTMAHTADLLRALAKHPHVTPPDLELLLTTLAEKLVAPAPDVLIHDEDEHLALVVVTALHRNVLGLPFLEGWLARLSSVAAQPQGDGAFDAEQHAAYQNTKHVLRALYFRLAALRHPNETEAALMPLVLDAVLKVSG